jgi:hypothetical protein
MALALSLDHLFDAGKFLRWNIHVRRAGTLQIDRELEFRRPLDRNVCRLGSAQ